MDSDTDIDRAHAPDITYDLGDLETRGFVVIPGFLGPDELEYLSSDYPNSPFDGNKNYPLRSPSPAVLARLEPHIDRLLAEVCAKTSVSVDTRVGAVYFATKAERGISFPWHQDHESYFAIQNHYDYLNLYMPIVKPDPVKSNLSVVPFDVLERDAKRTHRKLVRSGARHFQRFCGQWMAISDETGVIRRVPQDLDALGHTPHLAAGDLLIMRGDMVHKTQDADTHRVALSIRVADKNTVIRRSQLSSGGVRKALMMSNFAQLYQVMFSAFDATGRDEMSLDEMSSVTARMEIPAPHRRRVFLRQLLHEKRRAGHWTDLLVDAPRFVGLRVMVEAQQRYRALRSSPTG